MLTDHSAVGLLASLCPFQFMDDCPSYVKADKFDRKRVIHFGYLYNCLTSRTPKRSSFRFVAEWALSSNRVEFYHRSEQPLFTRSGRRISNEFEIWNERRLLFAGADNYEQAPFLTLLQGLEDYDIQLCLKALVRSGRLTSSDFAS